MRFCRDWPLVPALGTLAIAGCLLAGVSRAQPFPDHPVRVIVPFPSGGSVDDVMRLVGQTAGRGFVIDNRPGASGNIGTELAARAAPDGYTVLATTLPLVVNPALFGRPGYDVLGDFAPVSLLAVAPFVLVVHPALPVDNVKAFIAYARVRPGELNYASAGSGTNLHIAAELFNTMAKLSMVHVPYKGGGPALAALLAGETQLGFIGVLSAAQHAGSGRLRALGVTSAKRFPALGWVPTIAESGLPGYEFQSWYGVLAPRATPVDRVAALNGFFRNALRAPGMGERFAQTGAEVVSSTPDEFARFLRAELVKWAGVVRASRLKAE